MNHGTIVKCKICGKPFKQSRAGQMCCSRKCRDKYTRLKKKKKCAYCGKPYHSTKNTMFCCNECKKAYLKEKYWSNKICPQCGTEFYGPRYQKFCCNVCKQRYNKQFHLIEVKCDYCGEFYYKSEYQKGVPRKNGEENHNFCSHSCCMAYNYEHGIIQARQSSQHDKINKILDDLKIKYKNERVVGKFSLDIYLSDYQKAIEVMGLYWHGDSRKYRYDKLEERQAKCIEKDKRKMEFINNQEIPILYLWQIDIEKDIEKCIELIKVFIEDETGENFHSSEYELVNDELIKNDIKQYMQLNTLND